MGQTENTTLTKSPGFRLIVFFVSTYIVAWTFWYAAAAMPVTGLRGIVFLFGTFAPGFVAIWLTYRSIGHNGVMALLKRLVDWNVSVRWYVFALGFIVVVKLLAALAHRAITGAWPRFGETPWYLMLAAAILSTLIGGQAGEEIGWRGYALPRLTKRFGLAPASVLLGIIWACWHLPLFFIPQTTTTGQSFPLYLIQVTALSVAIAWLYANSRKSLLPVMLLHASVNNLKDIVPSADPNATNPWALSQSSVAWLTVLFLWVCAVYFLIRMRKGSQLERSVLQDSNPYKKLESEF